ncbi:hypothetical protein B0O99DRAFT_538505 [Bisporella sp. PMI_857]|nr:hypothetical protein B0O99DRAFT_538505 [Bisporella sp. PMI_857]
MPGVPSSRGCDGCRKQKKKCDQEKPACSRCRRLNLPCIGAGQQRYQFKAEVGFLSNTSSPDETLNPEQTPISTRRTSSTEVPQSPSNHLTLLSSSFFNTIKTTTSFKFNLLWTYGSFLEHIPQRLGNNAALDSAVNALVGAHSDICLRREISTSTLARYSRALRALRQYLDDPVKACAAETLCAVLILLTCQSFLGIKEKQWGHYEGAAQILRARRYYNPQDDFECKLLLSLRGPVLLGAIFDAKIHFSPIEWETIVVNQLNGATAEGIMMRCVARLPDFIQRGKRVCLTGIVDEELLHSSRENYQIFKNLLEEILLQVIKYRDFPEGVFDYATLIRVQAELQRAYVLALSIAIILNINLRSTDMENSGQLEAESNGFANEILAYEGSAAQYRPLGGSYMSMALQSAWMGSTDTEIRFNVEVVLVEYLRDFPRDKDASCTDGLEAKFWLLHPRKPACIEESSVIH